MLYSFPFLSTVDTGLPLGDDTQVYPKPGNIGYQPFFQTQNSGLRKTTNTQDYSNPDLGYTKTQVLNNILKPGTQVSDPGLRILNTQNRTHICNGQTQTSIIQ